MTALPTAVGATPEASIRALAPQTGEAVQSAAAPTQNGGLAEVNTPASFQFRLDERVRDLRPTLRTQPAELVGSATPAIEPVALQARPTMSTLAPQAVPRSRYELPQPQLVPVGPHLVQPPTSAIQGTGTQRWESVARSWRDFLGWSERSEQQIQSLGLPSDHPLVTQFRDEQRRRLIGLQLELGAAQFQMELVSKVIEHGTGGTRQVLQTQA